MEDITVNIQNRARLKMLDINERKNAGAVFVFHAL